MSKSPEASSPPRILAFGAHPDDIEFGCGAILLQAAAEGATIDLVVCSRGEAGSNGTPEERTRECEAAASRLGAGLRFLELGGDGHLEARPAHALTLAGEIRRTRPDLVLAPTTEPNQHPDHAAVGRLSRDACRLARFGGLAELAEAAPHAVRGLHFYAVAPSGEPASGSHAVWCDVSAFVGAWEALMRCHASQLRTRDYVALQLARAKTRGLEVGVEAVQVLYPNEPLVLSGLGVLGGGARRF
jgi:N-acetylglucosamine malate deacetylase 1